MYDCTKTLIQFEKPKGSEIGKQKCKISIREDGLSIRLSHAIDVFGFENIFI